MADLVNNVTSHWKTSIAGLLIAAATITGVLSQQGVTMGKIGAGTVVALIGALATALLGLVSKDPDKPSAPSVSGSTARLGVLMLCSLLVMGGMVGCSGNQVAQNIVNWTPALESAVATINSTASLLLPADAPIFAVATAGFDAAANELDAQAKAYLATPNASVLARLQTAVVTFQQTVNAALLQVAGIKDSASQNHAFAAINGVSTIVMVILGLVQSVSSKTALARMSAESPLKLAYVRRYVDEQRLQVVAESYGTTVDGYFAQEADAGF